MKKHLLLLAIFTFNVCYAWDTKANDSLPLRYTVKQLVVLADSSQNERAAPVFKRDKRAARKRTVVRETAPVMRNVQLGEYLFSNDVVSISSVYPNPAHAVATIDYNLYGDTENAKIILCNILGNVVGEYSLLREARRLNISTQDLSSGVYFYTLSVAGRNLVTRKLVVQHHS